MATDHIDQTSQLCDDLEGNQRQSSYQESSTKNWDIIEKKSATKTMQGEYCNSLFKGKVELTNDMTTHNLIMNNPNYPELVWLTFFKIGR